MHMHHLLGEEMESEYTIGRRLVEAVSCFGWCWETLALAIHLEGSLTGTTYLNFVSDQVDTSWKQYSNAMATGALPPVQKWFSNGHSELKLLTSSPISPYFNSIKHLCGVLNKQVQSMEALPPNFHDTENVTPDATGHLLRSCGLHPPHRPEMIWQQKGELHTTGRWLWCHGWSSKFF